MRAIKKYSAGLPEEQARNIVIEGDNLQALATLYRERGQVDLIIADPPYNTGNDFRYNDKWDDDPNDRGLGEIAGVEDRARHTKWMKFMWPRLQMMKTMLKPGGVLAICIDQRELFRLGQMLDELFREQNRIAIINWQRSYTRTNDATHVATTTEYVLVYARDVDKAHTGLLPRSSDGAQEDTMPDSDPTPWVDAPAHGIERRRTNLWCTRSSPRSRESFCTPHRFGVARGTGPEPGVAPRVGLRIRAARP
jgi:adenine-specific DNA-methyltransferase